MAKYQVVFTKLDNAIRKIARIRKMKNKLTLQRAFEKYRKSANKITNSISLKQTELLGKIKGNLKNLMKIYSRKRKIIIFKYFNKFKSFVENRNHYEKVEKKIKEINEKYKKETSLKDQNLTNLEQKIKQKTVEVEKLRENENLLKEKIKQKEEREIALKDALEKFKKSAKPESVKKGKDGEELLKELENKIRMLEAENKTLKEQWDLTQGNVEDFVQVITELIDSKDFASISRKI